MSLRHIIQPSIFILLFCLSFTAHAMTLQQAMGQLGNYKSQGLVGEQPNGYLGVVKPQGNAAELVQLINQARHDQYQKLANSNNIPLQEIEALAGKKAIDKTRSGLYIQLNGRWLKKP